MRGNGFGISTVVSVNRDDLLRTLGLGLLSKLYLLNKQKEVWTQIVCLFRVSDCREASNGVHSGFKLSLNPALHSPWK